MRKRTKVALLLVAASLAIDLALTAVVVEWGREMLSAVLGGRCP